MPASLRNKVTMRVVASRLRNQGFSMREKMLATTGAGDGGGTGFRVDSGMDGEGRA